MKPFVTVLLVALVVLAGCSQLAGPTEESTTTGTGPIEGTVPSASHPRPSSDTDEGSGPPRTTNTPTPAATVTAISITTPTATPPTATRTTTQSTTRTPTVTRTVRVRRTPAQPPTATRTPTATLPTATTPTAPTTRTATPPPKAARLVLGAINARDETVLLRNAGGRELDLTGYVVDFDDGQRYTLPAYTLRPGTTVTIHTGRGDNTQNDLYAGFFYPVINNNGDTVLIETPSGRIAAARQVN